MSEARRKFYQSILKEARVHLENEEPIQAAQAYQRARSTLGGHETWEDLLENALAEALAGNLLLSEYMLRTVLRNAVLEQTKQIAAYQLGSVLAAQRRFREANDAFSRFSQPLPWAAGGTMLSIRFPNMHFGWCLDTKLPFVRSVDGIGVGAVDPRVQFVYFVSCDSEYLKLFLEALYAAISRNVSLRCLLHVHVINPDHEAMSLAARLNTNDRMPIVFSSETVSICGLSEEKQRVYYSCARFLLISNLLEHYKKPIVVADIDQLVIGDVLEIIEGDSDADVRLLQYEHGVINFMAKFSASVILARPTPAASAFFDRVSEYIADRMSDSAAIGWHLDQVALAVAFFTIDSTRFGFLRKSVMHSGAPTDEIPEGTIFWSITYSIAANAAKLLLKDFEKFRSKTAQGGDNEHQDLRVAPIRQCEFYE